MKMKILLSIVAVVLIAAGASGTYYYYNQFQKAKTELSSTGVVPQNEVNALLDKLGKLMELPTDEQPQVGTISDTDLEKVKGQAFFSKAVAGDRVLIYNKAMKAILFRETANKIIEVAPVTISSPEPSAKATPKAKVEESPVPSDVPVVTP